MKLSEIFETKEEAAVRKTTGLKVEEETVDEAKPTKSYCQKTARDKMSASWLSSCISQGHKAHDTKKTHKVGGKRIGVDGKKMAGVKHGGPLPSWGDK